MCETLSVTWFQKIIKIWCLEDFLWFLFFLKLLFIWDTLLRHFTFILVIFGYKYYYSVVFSTMFTLCPFETKMESIFIFLPELYF
jgi:hypothetical protein